MDGKKILKAFADLVAEALTGTEEVTPQPVEKATKKSTNVVKAVNEEKKLATFVVLKAMSGDDDFDLHEDTYDAEEVLKACHNFNTKCMKANLGHMMMIDQGTAAIVQSFTTPTDLEISDQFVPEGSWLQVWKFADDALWDEVKEGKWTGLSVGCGAYEEEITDD